MTATTESPPDTGSPVDLELAAIVRRGRELALAIAGLLEQEAALAARFRALVPLHGRVVIDGAPAKHSPPNRQYDAELAVRVASEHGVAVARREIVDHADLKARLRAAGHLDDAMIPGAGATKVSWGARDA